AAIGSRLSALGSAAESRELTAESHRSAARYEAPPDPPARNERKRGDHAKSQTRSEEKEPPRQNPEAGQGLLRDEVARSPHREGAGRARPQLRLRRPQGSQG